MLTFIFTAFIKLKFCSRQEPNHLWVDDMMQSSLNGEQICISVAVLTT